MSEHVILWGKLSQRNLYLLGDKFVSRSGAVQIIECVYHAHLISKSQFCVVVNLHHLLSDGAAFTTQSSSSLASYAISHSKQVMEIYY